MITFLHADAAYLLQIFAADADDYDGHADATPPFKHAFSDDDAMMIFFRL